jgi:hypothetical protein
MGRFVSRRRILAGLGAGLVLTLVPLALEGQFRGGRFSSWSPNAAYDGRFTFARLRYPGGSWSHDYPQADVHLPRVLDYLTTVRANIDASNVYTLDDPELFQYPLLYVSEPGFWSMTDAQARNLRHYALKGGFLVFDDFEAEQWDNFARQLARALPEYRPIEIDASHPIFNCYFAVRDIYQPHPLVPVTPVYYGIFEDNDPARRMLGIINYNNDLAEYWEWSHTTLFSNDVTSEAYKLGVNYIIYAMTH